LNKTIIFGILAVLIIIYGCTSPEDAAFKKGAKRISEIDEQFGATVKTTPDSEKNVDELIIQLVGFGAANEDMPKALDYFLNFRIKTLEAEKLHIEGWQWGRASTIDWGFGCKKGAVKKLNSSRMRNSSAYKGYEAIETLQLFVDEFPDKAKSVNLTQKDVLFLNAAYQQVEDKAARDARVIRSACKEQIKELNITI
jgi:hypothetical protein|tara:strand:- start:181 stop:771 length:591 start_codon:yes stop_codon:yes gene_type:complete